MRTILLLAAFLPVLISGCSKNAQYYLTSGKEKYQFQDFNGAISDFSMALRKDSALAEAWYYRGVSKRAWNQNFVGLSFHGMMEVGKKDLKAQPAAISNMTLSDAMTPQPAWEKQRKNGRKQKFNKLFLRGEIADYDRALRLNPDYADALYWRAMAYLQFSRADLACPDLGKAISLGHPAAASQAAISCK